MSAQQEKQASHQEIAGLAYEVGEMKKLMSKMVDAINRISLLDERQQVVASTLIKLDDRMARMEFKQQEADISRAVNQANTDRLNTMDLGFREIHIDRERDKARFGTIVWMVRALWAIATTGAFALMYRIFTGTL